MSYRTTLEIVAPYGSRLKSYEIHVDTSVRDGEHAALRVCYARAIAEGVSPAMLEKCQFRVPRVLRSGLNGEAGHRVYPAPRMHTRSDD